MTRLSDSLIDELLYENEGAALDFKREQYRFDGASKDEKGELLKDVLAFANSWRRTTAYILIGVDERMGDRSEVVGISEHIDDAKLQQFVNSKTNRPVTFAYRTFSLEGKSIGIIEIPVQERPLYLKSDFGKLQKDTVYVRQGSSTAIAKLEEISRMGQSRHQVSPPTLRLGWADLRARTVLASPCRVETERLEPSLPGDTFKERRTGHADFMSQFLNPDYSKEVIEFAYLTHLLRLLGFHLQNESETVARRVRFVGRVKKRAGIIVRDWTDRPMRPVRDTMLAPNIDVLPLAAHLGRIPVPSVEAYAEHYEVTIDFGDVRPRDEVWTAKPILVGARDGGIIALDGELRGDNLPKPVRCRLEACIELERRPMELRDVQRLLERDELE